MNRPVIVAVSLVGGLLIGWKARPSSAETRQAPPAPPAPRADAPRQKWTREDLIKAMGTDLFDGTKNPLEDELASWSTAEIRAALEASLASPDCRMPGDASVNLPLLLMGAWMQRDFAGARAWFEDLAPGKDKEKMSLALAIHWPRGKGDEAFDYLLANRDAMKRATFPLVMHGIQSAANQGPSALIAFMARLRENGLEYPNAIGGGFPMGVQYPADFDFAALVASDEFAHLPTVDDSGAQTTAEMLLSKWHARDRDAAYDWLLEHRGVEGLKQLGGSYDVDPAENMRWLAGRTDALSPEEKDAFQSSVMPLWVFFPEKLQQFAESTRDPDLAEAAREYGVQAIFFGGTIRAIPVIESLDVETRPRLLESAEPDAAIMKARRNYRKFDDIDQSLLRKKLAEWNASEERIEAIISRFKK